MGDAVAPISCRTMYVINGMLFAITLLSTTLSVWGTWEIVKFDKEEPSIAYVGDAKHYLKVYDVCGVCDGDSSSCKGCDGVPNSGKIFDACGLCLTPCKWDGTELDFCTFNRTCADCAGIPNGVHKLDDCYECNDPASPEFARKGGEMVGCIGCDGIPFSGNVYDSCGVCDGPGCLDKLGNPLPIETRGHCCDCAGIPFGISYENICCNCVRNPIQYYLSLSGGFYTEPPINQSMAIELWDEANVAWGDAFAKVQKMQDEYDYRATVSTYPATEGILDSFRLAEANIMEAWDRATHINSDDNSTCWEYNFFELNMTLARDACGKCGGDNSTCHGCTIIAYDNFVGPPLGSGGVMYDDCGICNGENESKDACGICRGDNTTCMGCDGVPNSGRVFDACFGSEDPRMLRVTDLNDIDAVLEAEVIVYKGTVGTGCSHPDDFRAACDAGNAGCCGCDGFPNSGKVLDACGECLHPVLEKFKFNATCLGCDGVPNSGLVFDVCCDCGGNNTHFNSTCYQDYMTFLALQENPLPDAPVGWSNLNDLGRTVYDECGECRGWNYEGTTCQGCDGVHFSGVMEDACGVCGGNCSCAEVPECTGQDRGWTGLNGTCTFVQTGGPGFGDTPIYEQFQNTAGIKRWTQLAEGECVVYIEPPPPLPYRQQPIWFVKMFGAEFGPYSVEELELGYIMANDPYNGEYRSYPLDPFTLVGRVNHTVVQKLLDYGVTSQVESRMDEFRDLIELRVTNSSDGIMVPNHIFIENVGTALWYGRYYEMRDMPGLERVTYPHCSGGTWKGGEQRRHGKKTGPVDLGLITSNNISDESGLTDQPWNPAAEYIDDVSLDWMDQDCVCMSTWTYDAEPVPPTCERRWLTWDEWVMTEAEEEGFAEDGMDDRTTVSRTAAEGDWRVHGGWWQSDYGGGGVPEYGDIRYAKVQGDWMRNSMRGPWRSDSTGHFTITSQNTYQDQERERCYGSARLTRLRKGGAGAMWYMYRQTVLRPWSTTFNFSISDHSQQCRDVRQVTRSFSEEVRTGLHVSCTPRQGDGFAFVLQDHNPQLPNFTLGEVGSGLGYAGLRNSLAIEFDTWHNIDFDEPALHHISVHTQGSGPNTAAFEGRLAATVRIPEFADGKWHIGRIQHVPAADLSPEDLLDALEDNTFVGWTVSIQNYVSRGEAGLIYVYLDDMTKPLLTVPINLRHVLRTPSDGRAWVGFTAATGEGWQAIDLMSWSMDVE